MIRFLLIALATAFALAPTPRAWVEHLYSREAYLVLQNVLTPLSSLAGFALFDLLAVVGVVGLSGWWLVALRRSAHGCRWHAVGRMSLNTLALVASVYLMFLVIWGLNYRREPLTVKVDYKQQRVTAAALAELAGESVVRLNALHAQAHMQRWPDLDELPARLGPSFERVQRDLGVVRAAVTGRPKPTLLTPYFRRAGVDGMVNPFLLEVLVNTAVLPFERPFVVAHEWAHLAGYANESEASFVGWLTCLAGDPTARYSAWISLFPQVMRHLESEQQDEMWELLDEGPTEDFLAVANRVSHAVPMVRLNANRVYDRYLKANRVDEGIASYGKVVDLVLGSALGETAIRDAGRVPVVVKRPR